MIHGLWLCFETSIVAVCDSVEKLNSAMQESFSDSALLNFTMKSAPKIYQAKNTSSLISVLVWYSCTIKTSSLLQLAKHSINMHSALQGWTKLSWVKEKQESLHKLLVERGCSSSIAAIWKGSTSEHFIHSENPSFVKRAEHTVSKLTKWPAHIRVMQVSMTPSSISSESAFVLSVAKTSHSL